MRKRTILSLVVGTQEPDYGSEEYDRWFDEEVALFLYPRLVQIQHDRVGRLIGIGDVGHELRSDGITAMRSSGIVEIDDVEGRQDFIALLMV